MSWKQEFTRLRKKLVEEINISENALDKRVIRLAHKKSVTPKVALIILAKQFNIGYSRELQKLTADERNSVTSANISVTQNVTNSHHITQSSSIRAGRSRTYAVSKKDRTRQGKWHETWWGVILIGTIATVIGSLVISLL